MELTKFVVLGVYVAILFLIGIVASRRVKSMSDFYVGGKGIGFWAVAFSARATGESGWLLIGLTGMGALSGLSAYWVVVGEVLGVAISWWFMAKRFKRKSDEYGSMTVPDYLESHFKSTKKIPILKAGTSIISNINAPALPVVKYNLSPKFAAILSPGLRSLLVITSPFEFTISIQADAIARMVKVSESSIPLATAEDGFEVSSFCSTATPLSLWLSCVISCETSLFFIISNFGVWISSSFYSKDIFGLVACYVAAIPFYYGTLSGTIFYSFFLFGLYEFLSRKLSKVTSN